MQARDVVRSMKVSQKERTRLGDRPADETFGWEKEAAKARLEEVKAELSLLQGRLAAEGERSLLVVLQARDAAGKDGIIRSVMTGMNPAGVTVTSFKAPVGAEQRHDYLWRCHASCPADGSIGVWNRSHYEDVLVVRVKSFVPEDRWRPRFRHIREFERMLVDEGTRIVKIHVNVSKEEQRIRLQDRIDDPEEQWKHNAGDLADRELWDDFTAAYEDVFHETSTEWAPWFVVPGDRKWVRNLAVALLVRDTLRSMDPQLPPPDPSLAGITVK